MGFHSIRVIKFNSRGNDNRIDKNSKKEFYEPWCSDSPLEHYILLVNYKSPQNGLYRPYEWHFFEKRRKKIYIGERREIKHYFLNKQMNRDRRERNPTEGELKGTLPFIPLTDR